MKIGITATQKGLTTAQLTFWGSFIREGDEVHGGDCIGGDAQLTVMARNMKCRIVGHPPIRGAKRANLIYDEERRPKEYLVRNQDIVDETSILVAFPRLMDEELRSGTWHTIRYARRIGKQLIIVYPNGDTTCANGAFSVQVERR